MNLEDPALGLPSSQNVGDNSILGCKTQDTTIVLENKHKNTSQSSHGMKNSTEWKAQHPRMVAPQSEEGLGALGRKVRSPIRAFRDRIWDGIHPFRGSRRLTHRWGWGWGSVACLWPCGRACAIAEKNVYWITLWSILAQYCPISSTFPECQQAVTLYIIFHSRANWENLWLNL